MNLLKLVHNANMPPPIVDLVQNSHESSSGASLPHQSAAIKNNANPAITEAMQIQTQNELSAATLSDNVLDFSPFNFVQGIQKKRLLKGHSSMCKQQLVATLTCLFCNHVIVQGRECSHCEKNICTPCFRAWQQSESAKFYATPCKCARAEIKPMNRLKQELLAEVRFRCNNNRCSYQLTYDELLLGTHELDDCAFMQVICEGCGMRIIK